MHFLCFGLEDMYYKKFCDLYAEMVQVRHSLMFYTTMVHIIG